MKKYEFNKSELTEKAEVGTIEDVNDFLEMFA